MKQLKRLKKNAGIGLTTSLILVGGMLLVGSAVSALSISSEKNTFRSNAKVSATELAYAAISMHYNKIRVGLATSKTYPTQINPTTLTYTTTRGTGTAGVYSSRIVPDTKVLDQILADGSGNSVLRKTYTFELEGIGAGTGGVESVVRATFTGTQDESDGTYVVVHSGSKYAGNGVDFAVCPGAMSSNAAIRIKTNQGFRTYSADNKADVVANKGITWEPATGTKSSFTNPNVLDIQGQFQVPGNAEYAYIYDQTVGPSGLGNYGSMKNYRSPFFAANGSNPALDADTVARRAYPRPFPSPTMFNDWQTEWTNMGATGTKFAATVNSGNMPGRSGDGWKILKAPSVIDGDLLVAGGEQLRLMPTSPNPWENIVYVKGDVKNVGQLLNLGVTLVFEGKYSDAPGAEYKLDTQESPYSTVDSVMDVANLISLDPGPDAIKFTTSSSSTTGLVYSARGGIMIAGSNAEFTGKLCAAGDQDINIAPGGGASFVLNYNPHAGGNRNIVGSSQTSWSETLPAGTILRAFDAGRLEKWVTVK